MSSLDIDLSSLQKQLGVFTRPQQRVGCQLRAEHCIIFQMRKGSSWLKTKRKVSLVVRP